MSGSEPKYLGSTQRFYGASFVLFRKENKIAFVLRSNTGWQDGMYGLPSGRIDFGENPTQAAIREAAEETGVAIDPARLNQCLTIFRYSSSDKTYCIDSYFEASTWDGEVVNAEPHKHGELVWLADDDLPNNVKPSVRFAIEQVRAGNTYAEFGWNPTEIE